MKSVCLHRTIPVLIELFKGIEFLPQTKIFWFQYLRNLMVQTFDISNLGYFIYKY